MHAGLEALLIGRTLAERYVIEEVIGRGGMSVVYRATDRALGRPVAVKVIAHEARSEEQRRQLRERFRREAGAVARIPPHPNVVHVYDYGTDPTLGLDFLVMELLRGRDLKRVLAAGPLPRPQALRVLLEAARGVAAGHRAGVVHRDVKPANLFLTGEERIESVRVLDFGIAKALELAPVDDLTVDGAVAPHSPAYASPEQLDAARRPTPASDVFQLGLVGYELLAGARPFTDAERLRLQAGERVPLPVRGGWAEVPAGVRAVIERALHPDPAARFADAAEFATALAQAAGEEEAAAVSLAAAVADAPVDDRTLLADDAATLAATPPPAAPPAGTATAARRGGWHRGNTLRLTVGGLAAVLAMWAAAALLGGRSGTGAAAGDLDVRSLDAEFRVLQLAAARALLDELPADEGADAAAEVERVIVDLTRAWVDGDLERHAAHYAERVDFYGRRYSRARVLRERRETRERYPDVEIRLERRAVHFPEPGRARALVDRSWSFRAPDARWEGAGRQELRLELRDGRWQIVAERDVEVYRSERSDG